MKRRLSYSELSTALTCWARWDLSYSDVLAGSSLTHLAPVPILSEGSAWGAGVAEWHRTGSLLNAIYAMRESLYTEGHTPSELIRADDHLSAVLAHYSSTAERLPSLTRIEEQIIVPLPARTRSGRASTKYAFECFLDGWTVIDGLPWIVEFKLRGGLTPVDLIVLQRQQRWYAWALAQTGVRAVGVLTDERLNEAPKPPRMVKGRKKDSGLTPSHAKDQLTTPDAYREVCAEHGVDPSWETLSVLEARQWQHRVPIVFRPGEIEEAGRELRDAAHLISLLDQGALSPIRHATRMNCGGCRFRPICADPGDTFYVESLFKRQPPKRLREEKSSEVS